MEASQRPSRERLEAVPCAQERQPSLEDSQENLVIEDLTEFATAGVAGVCGTCWADCATPLMGHDEHRNSPWASQTAA
jgi:hypothetical protein